MSPTPDSSSASWRQLKISLVEREGLPRVVASLVVLTSAPNAGGGVLVREV